MTRFPFKFFPITIAGLALACCLVIQSCSALESTESEEIASNGWVLHHEIGAWSPPVASIAFSPDGSQIATTHTSLCPSTYRCSPMLCVGYLKLWKNDLFALNRVSVLVEDLTREKVAFRSDGKQILVPAEKGVVAWDLDKKQLVQTPPAWGLTISPDGRFVAARPDSEDKSGSILVMDLQSQTLLSKIRIPDRILMAYSFSPDNRLLVLGVTIDFVSQKKLIVWNLKSASQRCVIELPSDVKLFPTFSSDAKQVATLSNDNKVRLWNTSDGSLIKTFDGGEEGRGYLWQIAFSPDGKFLAAGYEEAESDEGGGAIVWNVNSGERVTEISDKSAWGVTAVAFSPDGKLLATGNSAGEIKFWNVPEE